MIATYVLGMSSNETTERVRADAEAELRRAVRDFPTVDVVDAGTDGVAIRGDASAVRAVKPALWNRELSAKAHGQDQLAAADATARSVVEGAT